VSGDLTADDFPVFFRCVHGWTNERGWAVAEAGPEPFPWQMRLLRDWVGGPRGWPPVLNLPTGSGKTVTLDIAVFHLAMDTYIGEYRRGPARIAFVVDRRLIVDDAYNRAKKIEAVLARAARDASAPEVVRKVTTRLGRLAERPERPLLARRLRSGMPRQDDWTRTPTQPTILCSTVDQVGSRLLFRGYGLSDSMKPVHAGLLGSDCLILLDEVHLSEPFRQTLKVVARHRVSWRDPDWSPATPFATALLTATPSRASGEPFGLNLDDRNHPRLRLRLEVAKPATLVAISGKKDRRTDDNERQRVTAIEVAVEAALAHVAQENLETPAVIGVVVNQVLRARRVFQRLQEVYGPRENGVPPRAEVFLVIGPAREVDREELVAQLDPIKTDHDQQRREMRLPHIIVASQAIEAGADLDFDALITEVATLDALKQRFGRLNRAGRLFTPYSAILAHEEDERPGKGGDPVYGHKAAETWTALRMLAASRGRGNQVNFGASLSSSLPCVGEFSPDLEQSLLAPKANAPVPMPAYIDLWSQTSPIPAADPEISLFLHGPARSPANILIVWRADLELANLEFDQAGFDAKALLASMPPKPGEAVEVSLTAARRWLRSEPVADFADSPERDYEEGGADGGRPSFRWAGRDSPRTKTVRPHELRPNDLIVVPADYGGCDKFGWNPGSGCPVKDVADEAASPFVDRHYALRLTPKLIEALAPAASDDNDESAAALRERILRFTAAFVGVMGDLRDGRQRGNAVELIFALREAEPPPGLDRALAHLDKSQKRGRPLVIYPYGYDEEGRRRGFVLLAPRGIERAGREPDAELEGGLPATEDDWLGSMSGSGQTLDEHSRDVQECAIVFSKKAGLRGRIAADIALAAYLHDAGKADPRFQAMLYGGEWLAIDDTRVLAKSAHSVPLAAWYQAGLPDQWRHETLSVRVARAHPLFAEANDPELVLWLIGVHHGYGRPLFPHAEEAPPEHLPDVLGGAKAAPDPGPQSLAFSFNGWDWPQIFERLKRRYGVWELARLEAILRLADHRASEGEKYQMLGGAR